MADYGDDLKNTAPENEHNASRWHKQTGLERGFHTNTTPNSFKLEGVAEGSARHYPTAAVSLHYEHGMKLLRTTVFCYSGLQFVNSDNTGLAALYLSARFRGGRTHIKRKIEDQSIQPVRDNIPGENVLDGLSAANFHTFFTIDHDGSGARHGIGLRSERLIVRSHIHHRENIADLDFRHFFFLLENILAVA